jgi:hypothetical protein
LLFTPKSLHCLIIVLMWFAHVIWILFCSIHFEYYGSSFSLIILWHMTFIWGCLELVKNLRHHCIIFVFNCKEIWKRMYTSLINYLRDLLSMPDLLGAHSAVTTVQEHQEWLNGRAYSFWRRQFVCKEA